MEADDPLARLKSLRTEAAEAPVVVAATEKPPYLAFKAVNRRQLRLHLKAARNTGKYRLGERIGYHFLHRIIDDDDCGEQLALVYQFAVVFIRGRNLFSVAEAIEREVCEWVQPFDAAKWEKPANPEAPFVESIEIRVDREQIVALLDEFLGGADRPSG